MPTYPIVDSVKLKFQVMYNAYPYKFIGLDYNEDNNLELRDNNEDNDALLLIKTPNKSKLLGVVYFQKLVNGYYGEPISVYSSKFGYFDLINHKNYNLPSIYLESNSKETSSFSGLFAFKNGAIDTLYYANNFNLEEEKVESGDCYYLKRQMAYNKINSTKEPAFFERITIYFKHKDTTWNCGNYVNYNRIPSPFDEPIKQQYIVPKVPFESLELDEEIKNINKILCDDSTKLIKAIFSDSLNNLNDFIKTNLKYPRLEQEADLEAKYIGNFTINEKGELFFVRIYLDSGDFSVGFVNEIRRILSIMPNWKPATVDGKPYCMSFSLPLKFKLN